MPTYLRRWTWCGLLLGLLGVFVEIALGAPRLSALFYVPGVFAVPVAAVIGVAWLALKSSPEPGRANWRKA